MCVRNVKTESVTCLRHRCSEHCVKGERPPKIGSGRMQELRMGELTLKDIVHEAAWFGSRAESMEARRITAIMVNHHS